ncbi:MAG: 1-acyl-sn-glycerol-3-phosphate acyltransferase [Planctomycetes bacterium]|nr:1-acyl-sn-glycerol-3-phosphate acyltransferase [Planctomycetota bacterium]
MKLVWAVWSLVFWPLAFLVMLSTFLLALPCLLFVPFHRIQGFLVSPAMRLILLLTLSRYEVRHHPRYEPERVSFFIFNHTSLFDPAVFLASYRRPACSFANAVHTRIPIYGWLFRLGSVIPVNPGRDGQTAELGALVKERASRGLSIVILPEAHRTLDGKVRPFRRGGFFMARDAGLPLVPMAAHGLREILPKGSWIVRPGRISVFVGPQVDSSGMSDEEVDRTAEHFREYVAFFAERGETPPDELLCPRPEAQGLPQAAATKPCASGGGDGKPGGG